MCWICCLVSSYIWDDILFKLHLKFSDQTDSYSTTVNNNNNSRIISSYPSRRQSRLFKSARLDADGILASGGMVASWTASNWSLMVLTRPWTKWCCWWAAPEPPPKLDWVRLLLDEEISPTFSSFNNNPCEAASNEAPWSWPGRWGLRRPCNIRKIIRFQVTFSVFFLKGYTIVWYLAKYKSFQNYIQYCSKASE